MRPLLLCILDGLGYRESEEGNAVKLANTPTLDMLDSRSPSTLLLTHGEHVGLPKGQMGNSEVGHLNIGAGRVVEQDLVRINRELINNAVLQQPVLIDFLGDKSSDPSTNSLHLIGLCSSGGVHSQLSHIVTLIPQLETIWSGKIIIHLITDGRDVPPNASFQEIPELLNSLSDRCSVGTVSGRYYTMDRDSRWERVSLAYQALHAQSERAFSDPLDYISTEHAANHSDEFILPAQSTNYRGIGRNDLFLLWNYRSDRMREIYRALTSPSEVFANAGLPEHPVVPEKNILTFTEYDENFHCRVLFPTSELCHVLGEVVASSGKTQLRIAETEKYPHVTYFFNGGQETSFPGEDRIIIPSPRDVKTYDEKPEMSAHEVSTAVQNAIASEKYDFIVLNFANPDMVGHTGNLQAVIKAIEVVDIELGDILKSLKQAGGEALIFADHGNAEEMFNLKDGGPHTFHTINPVKLWYVGKRPIQFSSDSHALCDIAPTTLKLMGIAIPKEMTGNCILSE